MEQLGVNGMLLLAQIVNFGLVVFLLQKLLFKPVLTMLDKRRAKIDEGLKFSDAMIKEKDAFEEKKQKMQDTARKEAQAIVNDAKKQAKIEAEEIVSVAHADASQILVKAKAEAEAQTEAMRATLKSEAVELAKLMVERLIPEFVSGDNQQKLLDKQLKDIATATKRVH